MRVSASDAASDHRPHDLLWVGDAADLTAVDQADALPAWATPAWIALAPVVVRRAPRVSDRVPVGLRGATRSQRCAAEVLAGRVLRKVTPHDIARGLTGRRPLRESRWPCLRALARLAGELDAAALDWGVTGSVGFTLASGLDVLRADSDLDLLVRSGGSDDAAALGALARPAKDAESRVDIQVETPRGAFALSEWWRTGGPVLLKTDGGPLLCDDPWQAAGIDGAAHAAAGTG